MKLRNKKTGGIIEFNVIGGQIVIERKDKKTEGFCLNSLKQLNEEWEDYEDPKKHWFISEFGRVYCVECFRMDKERIGWLKEIGNWFDSEEDAEKVVKKFKAFNRLKNKGFKFSKFAYTELCDYASVNISAIMINDCINDDLELLFGDE